MREVPIDNEYELLKWITEYVINYEYIPEEELAIIKEKYKPFIKDPDAIQLLSDIEGGIVEKTKENMTSLVLKQIIYLINKDLNDTIMEVAFDFFVEYDMAFLYECYNSVLEKTVNQKVNVFVRKSDGATVLDGILINVVPKESVTIDELVIPFISYKSYIKRIKNERGLEIYNNRITKDAVSLIEPSDIEAEKAKIFGETEIVTTRGK